MNSLKVFEDQKETAEEKKEEEEKNKDTARDLFPEDEEEQQQDNSPSEFLRHLIAVETAGVRGERDNALGNLNSQITEEFSIKIKIETDTSVSCLLLSSLILLRLSFSHERMLHLCLVNVT